MPVKKKDSKSDDTKLVMEESEFNEKAGVPKVSKSGRPVKEKSEESPDERVDVIITFSRIGTHKVVTGKYTGEQIFVYAVVNKSFGVAPDGTRRPGVNIKDAEALQDTEVPFWCPRTQEWCKTKPFRIVIT